MIGKSMQKEKIDFVIIWVDGSDEEWQKVKREYQPNKNQDAAQNRYRDWENLKYWFRGVEKFAPWVNMIHFVTCGQCPEWLNTNHPKLHMVDHKDYIPQEYLPTFSANPIELNFHRIDGLSEQFVYFNDDFFIMNYVKEEDFFWDGKPKDMLMEYPIGCGGNNEVFSHLLANDFNLIGRHFQRSEIKKRLKKKILSPKYGKYAFYNWCMYHFPFPNFFGVLTPHFAQPYLKSSYEKVWEAEKEVLENTCKNRFRSKDDVNSYVFRIWNLMEGNFVPDNRYKIGKAYFIRDEKTTLYQDMLAHKYKLICINDDCSDEVYEAAKIKVNSIFEQILPDKSGFEL